ncbi:hypothetical protein BSKO_04994 [Bryopsis sp. KO-2023]|nr:hypothetical protein BSKO_04994 [Bryopsis sp. KO-2023]
MDMFLSEVHVESCPPGEGEWTTVFPVETDDSCSDDGECMPSRASLDDVPILDADGDLVVRRRPRKHRKNWTLRHFRKTILKDVGTQVWRGACLMSEFILSRQDLFQGKTIVELGCGVGLLGIALGTIPQNVFLTDANAQALTLAEENVKANLPGTDGHVRIRRLDWSQPPRFLLGAGEGTQIQTGDSRYGGTVNYDWSQEDMHTLQKTDTYLAADVVFDDEMTDAFLACLQAFFALSIRHGNTPRCYMALEKRMNFTIEDLEARAPAYEHLMEFIATKEPSDQPDAGKMFFGHPIPIDDVPKKLGFERTSDLELWILTPNHSSK